MENRELPLAVWYPLSVEPQIGEPIMFCSLECIDYYTQLYGLTSVQISIPNEIKFGTYVGNRLVEVLPGKTMRLGVWAPCPLFFTESSIRSLMIAKEKAKKV
jgi:hypothetical protein